MTTTPDTTTTTPAAWIGCLSCYNNGHLRGKWITAQQAADEMNSAPNIVEADKITYGGQAYEMKLAGGVQVTACRKCGGDEFDVFDTEHLPTKMTAAEFYRNAETLAALDDAGDLERITTLASWLGGSMTLDDLITYDETNYVGQWGTFQDYAEQYLDDVGDLATIPEHLAYYFDYASYARDLAHDYYHDDTTGHTWRSC